MAKNDKNDKLDALESAISHIEKQYGKGAIMKLGDSQRDMNVETIPTGSLSCLLYTSPSPRDTR